MREGAFFLLFLSGSVLARPLEIFLAPHSHCDAGWLYTVDAYYTEWHGPHGAVKAILDSVFASLSADSTLRFNWAEMVWFSRWWAEQSSENQKEIRRLVDTGQWEFVGGGWVQSDEMVTHWKDVTDQMMTGHEELRTIFGHTGNIPKVRTGWQLDMFTGFSGTTPALWYQAGFDSEVIRFEPRNEEMRDEWETSQELEFMWSQPNGVLLGAHRKDSRRRQAMLTHAIRNDYSEVVNLGFTFNDGDEPITDENIAERSASLVEWALDTSSVYLQTQTEPGSNRLLALWGSDFRFGNAIQWFGNMSRVVNFINENSEQLFNNATIKFSTVSEYMDVVEDYLKQPGMLELSTKEGIDFAFGWPRLIPLPNGNTSLQYTTGALSSRARFKQLVRNTGAQQRAAEVAFMLRCLALEQVMPLSSSEREDTLAVLDAGRKTLALVQHHDAITGTMFKNNSMDSLDCCERCSSPDCMVLEDYTSKIKIASINASAILTSSVAALSGISPQQQQRQAKRTVGAGGQQTVAIFNSLAHERSDVAFLPIDGEASCASVRDESTGSLVPTQLNATGVFFKATVPGFGISIFTVNIDNDRRHKVCSAKAVITTKGPARLENQAVAVLIDADSKVSGLQDKISNVNTTLQMQYGLYENVQGGAYSMVETQKSTPQTSLKLESIVEGPVFSEATFSGEKIKQTIRIAATADPLVRVTHELLQPNPLQTELTAEYLTDLRNKNGYLWNDDSGLLMHQRPPEADLPIAARFHAAVQSVYLVDEDSEAVALSPRRQLSVLVAHSTGVASLEDGKLEFILQRRVNTTDNQGPWPMNDGDGDGDDSLLFAIHGLVLGPVETANKDRLRMALEMENPLVVVPLCSSSWPLSNESCFTSSFSPLKGNNLEADSGIHVLNFKIRDANPLSAIFQIQNLKEEGLPLRIEVPPEGLFDPSVTMSPDACAELSLTLQSKLGECNNTSTIELGTAPDIKTFVFEYKGEVVDKIQKFDVETNTRRKASGSIAATLGQ